MKKFRTPVESQVGEKVQEIFNECPDSVEIKMENFAKYVRRQHLKRFLAFYEIFKMVLPVKGSVIECGVNRGFSLMSWAKLSTILEPENLTRRIYGFDTFEGFPQPHKLDQNPIRNPQKGDFKVNCQDELKQLIHEYDKDRFLGHIDKVHLVKGDLAKTIPQFLKKHPHVMVSLLFMDVDLYEPTKAAIELLLPRMPKGAVLAFDELDNPLWPGETMAVLDSVGIRNLEIRRLEWDPYIGYAVL